MPSQSPAADRIAKLARDVLAAVAAAFMAAPVAQDALQQHFSDRRPRIAQRVRARFARR